MKKFKLDRNIYIFVGFCFLLSTLLQLRFLQISIFQLQSNKRVIVPVLCGIASVIMFINAYISHKKIIKDIKSEDNK